MKKLFILLAAVGLFASCSKEEPVAPVAPEQATGIDATEAPVPADATSTDPNAPHFNFAFEADLDDLEVTADGFSDGSADQELRGTAPEFFPLQDTNGKNSAMFMRLLLGEDSQSVEGEPQVQALVYLYDDAGNQAYFLREVKYHAQAAGAKLYHDSEVIVPQGYPGSARGLQKMIERNFATAKMALIIGFDPENAVQSRKFTNKGAVLVKYGETVKLPKNFVMLKSVDNELEWHPQNSKAIRVKPDAKGNNRIKLTLQGYVLAVRFNNTFPATVRKMQNWTSGEPQAAAGNRTVKRPDLRLDLRINGLSATYQNDITFLQNKGTGFNGIFGVKPTNVGHISQPKKNFNTPGFTAFTSASKVRYYTIKPMVEKTAGSGEFEASNAPIRVPVNKPIPAYDKTKPAVGRDQRVTLRDGEQVVLIYCPNPQDAGSIGYEARDRYFYDGSAVSSLRNPQPTAAHPFMYYNLLPDKYNKITKLVGSPNSGNPSWRKAQEADAKLFIPIFNIRPAAGGQTQGITITDGLTAAQAKALRDAYNERNKEAI